MKSENPLVITIVGAESSGKTTLAKQLASALSCTWYPEYARAYLEKLDRPYMQEDLIEIAKGEWGNIRHIQKEKYGINWAELFRQENFFEEDFISFLTSLKRDIVIVDGGLFTIRMWAMIKYATRLQEVEDMFAKDPTSFYLLCRPRNIWESDPLREAPLVLDRAWIYNEYLKELYANQFPFLFAESLSA